MAISINQLTVANIYGGLAADDPYLKSRVSGTRTHKRAVRTNPIIKLKNLSVFLLAAMLAVGINGCDKGPAESAGEAFDEAFENAGEAIGDVQKKVQDVVEEQEEK